MRKIGSRVCKLTNKLKINDACNYVFFSVSKHLNILEALIVKGKKSTLLNKTILF